MELSYQYSIQCRYNTLNGITPSNVKKYNTSEHKTIFKIGEKYIEEVGINEFSKNFQGDQYFVGLWTAHIIFEHENANRDLKRACIKIIKEYADNPFSPAISDEESEWLRVNHLRIISITG